MSVSQYYRSARRPVLRPGDGRPFGAPEHAYTPYAVDWRFLPEEALMIKDTIRHHFVSVTDAMAQTRTLSRLWAGTIGRRTIGAIEAAEVLFVHVPKTGGTSISKCLYGRNLPHYTAEFYSRTFARRISALPSFSVIRHPVERVLSGYKMALLGGTDIVLYSRYDQSRLRGLESMDAFVDFLFENRKRLSYLPSTFREQASFVLDADGRVMVDRLFSLDSRNGLPSELGRWLGIESIPHLNATKPKVITVSEESRAKILEIYSVDMEIYSRLVSMGGCSDMKGAAIARVVDSKDLPATPHSHPDPAPSAARIAARR